MQTLQIGCSWPSERAGGGERVLADLVRYLPMHGIGLETLVAGPVDRAGSSGSVVSTFGEVTDGTRTRWLGARRAVRARLASGGVDLVASHFALYASAALDDLRRVPHVVHFHGPWAAESREEGAGRLSGAAKWGVERMVYASADRVIVLSEAFARLAERDYAVRPDRLRVVPGAADLRRFSVAQDRLAARRTLGWSTPDKSPGWPIDAPTLVTVRRLVRRTGVDRLVQALAAIVAATPAVRLMVGGTGPQLPHLREQVAALGLERHVTFLGYVPDAQLPLVYRAADINVLPTLALEGFGLTAVEALAVGTPSMVTPVGGLPEVVSPLSPSLVFASTEAHDIAAGLTSALTGRTPLPTATACRSFALAHFSAEHMAQRVAAVYGEVC
jgi:glycosyltransferase involved in cell wall biosynthesis